MARLRTPDHARKTPSLAKFALSLALLAKIVGIHYSPHPQSQAIHFVLLSNIINQHHRDLSGELYVHLLPSFQF